MDVKGNFLDGLIQARVPVPVAESVQLIFRNTKTEIVVHRSGITLHKQVLGLLLALQIKMQV